MTGSIGNYCEFTDDITASGTWAATNCTKSAAQRVGPHGLTDNSVTDLDATAASGRIQQQAETTWNGWKTFVVWMINISGSGTVNLRLRNSSGEVEPGLCTLSSDWRPYAVTGNDTSTDAVTVRIELSDNSDNIAIWNPILRDGILPGPGLINDSTSAISDENALVFPGGAYFGWEKVGRVFTATHNWNPGSVADGGIVTDTDTVAKAALGDFVEVAPAVDIGDLQLYGHVSAANTVKLYLINNSGGAIDPNGGAAFDVYIRVWERP
ncbi:MAG: hypothetical protein GWN77_06535 [Gammaproteobacteria bacterium]|nr:hypothetical protein [Gammaproteobacteria bacterium]